MRSSRYLAHLGNEEPSVDQSQQNRPILPHRQTLIDPDLFIFIVPPVNQVLEFMRWRTHARVGFAFR